MPGGFETSPQSDSILATIEISTAIPQTARTMNWPMLTNTFGTYKMIGQWFILSKLSKENKIEGHSGSVETPSRSRTNRCVLEFWTVFSTRSNAVTSLGRSHGSQTRQPLMLLFLTRPRVAGSWLPVFRNSRLFEPTTRYIVMNKSGSAPRNGRWMS